MPHKPILVSQTTPFIFDCARSSLFSSICHLTTFRAAPLFFPHAMSDPSDFAAYQEAEKALCNKLDGLLRVHGLMKGTEWAELTARHAKVVRQLVEEAQVAMDDMSDALGQHSSVDFGSSAKTMRDNYTEFRAMVGSCIAALGSVVEPARHEWAKASSDVLELLNCYRDADPGFARTSRWAEWLATVFFVAGVRRYLGGDGLAVYYKIIQCLLNSFESDPESLESLGSLNKVLVLALLPQDGAGGATHDKAFAIDTLRGLLK